METETRMSKVVVDCEKTLSYLLGEYSITPSMCVFVHKRVYVCVGTCVELVGEEHVSVIEYIYIYMYSYTYFVLAIASVHTTQNVI